MSQLTDEALNSEGYALLGKLLEEYLTPVGLEVHKKYPLILQNPGDFLLIKREEPHWTSEQYNRLPDGIRDASEGHILLILKSASLDKDSFEDAIWEALGIMSFYRQTYELKNEELQMFLVCAETPSSAILSRHQCDSITSGVYKSRTSLVDQLRFIFLDELSPAPHNAFIKCLASQQKEKERAFEQVRRAQLTVFTHELYWFMAGLWAHWFVSEASDTTVALTPEQAVRLGREWGESFF